MRRTIVRSSSVEEATRRYLLYGVLPFWFVPGVADYVLHRRTRIEQTSGARESFIHALMMTEVGVPVLLGLLLEINPAVLALMAAGALIHEATAVWDVRAAVDGGREVLPAEQHVHSFLESLPFAAFGAVACLHWDDAVRALRGSRRRAWALRPKHPPLARSYVGGLLAAIGMFIALPYGEELLRCLRRTRTRPPQIAQPHSYR